MRNTYQYNQTFKLLIQITDSDGISFDPDDGPYVDVFAPSASIDDDTTAIVLNASQVSYGDSGQQGTTYIVKEDTGLYSYVFPIAVDAETGSWIDRWTFTHDSIDTTVNFNFTVIENPFVTSIKLQDNQWIHIKLVSIASADDAEDLLEDASLDFYTTITPTYSSSNLVLLEAGGYLQGISEADIEIAIYKYSLDADTLTFRTVSNREFYEYIRRQWVTCSAARELLINKVNNMVKKKTLADLSVEYDPTYANKIKDLSDCVQEMQRMLSAGGALGPGTSERVQVTVPGINAADRPEFGRRDLTSPWRAGGNTHDKANDRSIRVSKTFKPKKSNW